MPAFDPQHMLDLLNQGQASEVIAALEPVVEQTPAHLSAYVMLARAYEAHERWGDALQAWEQARYLLPNSPAITAGVQRVLRAQESDPLVSSVGPPPASDEPSLPSEEARSEEVSEEPDPARPDESTRKTAPQMPPDLQHLAEKESGTSGDSSNELDRLIQELESARIEPDPDLDSVPTPDLDDDIEDMVSETLARIYTSQEQYGEAARVYTKLATQDPDRAEEHLEKAAEMRARAEEQKE